MIMNSVTNVLIVFIVILNLVKAQNVCTTAGREPGKCVPIDTCFIIKDILSNLPKPVPPKFTLYLQKSYCDLKDEVQYVCCAERHITQTSSSTQTTVLNTVNDRIIMETENYYEDISKHPSLNLLSQNVCGRIAEDKISNGNITALAEFPWMVLLRYDTSEGLKSKCGGSLISPRYVLTAAHCVTGIIDPVVAVRLGEYDTSKDIDCEEYESNQTECMPAVQDIPIEEVISHPKFNRPRYANDVAVIRLQSSANIDNENVLPICLPTKTEIQNTELNRVTISGWGLMENQVVSTILMKAIIPVVPNEECQRAFKRSARITSAQICAGGEKGIDSCRGDSGGPLFYPANVGGFRYVQFGIISAGLAECGSSTSTPGIYARVAFYMKWILDQLKP